MQEIKKNVDELGEREASELNTLPTFDFEEVYDNEIYPLLKKIIEICKKLICAIKLQN